MRVVTAPVDLLARHPHRRHAGHQRDHPRARAADDRVRAARRSRAVRDVGRPAVHRNGARVPRSDPRLGQEDRHRRQQDRHLRARRPSSTRCSTFVGDAAARRCSASSRKSFRSARAWRCAPSRASRRCGRPAASRRSSASSATRSTSRAGSGSSWRTRSASADALARRYVGDRRTSGWRCSATTSACSTTSSGSWRSLPRRSGRGFELRMSGGREGPARDGGARTRYFDDTLRLGRVFDLLNRSRVQREFEEQVVADAPRQIERRVSELIDWLVDQDFRQWQAVTARLATRRQEHGDRILGSARHRQLSRRSGAPARLGRPRSAARRGHVRPAARGRSDRRPARAPPSRRPRPWGRGALGLGALVTLAATTAAADVTGILMASVVAALGFLIIPAKRRKARTEIRARVSSQVNDLRTALGAEFRRAPGTQRAALRRLDGPLHEVRARGTRAMGRPSLVTHDARRPHQAVAVVARITGYLSLWISLRRTGCCP